VGGAEARQARRLVAFATVVLLAGALALPGCGRLDQDAIGNELGTIESAAAEGMLVAREAAHDRAPDNFIELRAAELGKVANGSYEKLNEIPAEGSLQPAEDKGIRIAAHVAALLFDLHAHSSDRELADSTERRLRQLADQAGAVEDSL
jgi:hypothetical protein